MSTLDLQTVYNLARDAGLSTDRAIVAAAVAMAESGGVTDAMGDTGIQDATWGPSVGLWQIRSLKAQRGTGRTRDADRLTSPAFNAASMVEISSNGTDFNPWSAYKNGSWRRYIEQAASIGQTDIAGNFQDVTGIDLSWVPGMDLAQGAVDVGADIDNAFANWQTDAMRIGLTVAGAGVALALLVLGVKQTVGGD